VKAKVFDSPTLLMQWTRKKLRAPEQPDSRKYQAIGDFNDGR
jgi:hypothetical protein